jgi:replicative DNA helicase
MADIKQTFDGRGVPQNLEAERSVLGALLLHPDAVADVTFLKPEDFYLPRHQLIFQAVLTAYNQRRAAVACRRPAATSSCST